MRKYIIYACVVALLFILALPGCGEYRREKDPDGYSPVSGIDQLMAANQEFKLRRYGLSDMLESPYYGYCKQTADLFIAEIEENGGVRRIKKIDRAVCAETDANGNSTGYYYRYIVTAMEKKDGKDNVTGFIIVAWPETVGRTGVFVYIVNEDAIVYRRSANESDEGTEPPLTAWPSEEELAEQWINFDSQRPKDYYKFDNVVRRSNFQALPLSLRIIIFAAISILVLLVIVYLFKRARMRYKAEDK